MYLLSYCTKNNGKQYQLVYAPTFEEAVKKLQDKYFYHELRDSDIQNETIQ